jgi:putative PIN family toxin of toxin-antitoxin system
LKKWLGSSDKTSRRCEISFWQAFSDKSQANQCRYTNVLIAAFISHGTCAEILEHCVLKHDLFFSKSLLKEFQGILRNKFQFSRSEVSQVFKLVRPAIHIVLPRKLETRICRDPDDDLVLATAVAANCNCILTGDKDLLEIKIFQNIDILLPNDFWRYEAGKTE